MFTHGAKGILPPAPRLSDWTNNQVVVPELKFDLVVEMALFQECFGDADTTRIPNLNEASFHQQTFSPTVLTLEGENSR